MTTTPSDLRARWASIPGVTFAATTTAPASPPRNKRNPGAASPNRQHRPACYLRQPDIYTTRGTHRIHPIGTPTEPGWITAAQACAILNRSRSHLTYLARTFALDSCTFASHPGKRVALKYYREDQIRALLRRPDRRRYSPGRHQSSQH